MLSVKNEGKSPLEPANRRMTSGQPTPVRESTVEPKGRWLEINQSAFPPGETGRKCDKFIFKVGKK